MIMTSSFLESKPQYSCIDTNIGDSYGHHYRAKSIRNFFAIKKKHYYLTNLEMLMYEGNTTNKVENLNYYTK